MSTIYAVCTQCAHIEPRPAHTAEDWTPCECCGEPTELDRDCESALDRSDDILADLRQPLI